MVPLVNRRDGFTQHPVANYSHPYQIPSQSSRHSQKRAIDPLMAQAISMLPKPPTYIPSLKCTWSNKSSPLDVYQQQQQQSILPPAAPQFYNPAFYPVPAPNSQWARAPGAERRSIDLSTLPPPPVDLQAQANAQAFINQQQAIATANEQAQAQALAQQQQQQQYFMPKPEQHQPKQSGKQQNAVNLSGFASEAIWDLCWSSSPAFGNLNDSQDEDVVMQTGQPAHYRQPSWSVYAGGEDIYGRPKLEPTIEFRRWTYSILTQTALSKQALFLALFYASRLPIHSAPNVLQSSPDSAPYRLLTIALALSNRWLDDNTYTNKTWSEVTGLGLKDIGALDMWALVDQSLDVNVSTDEWTKWMYRIRAREEKVEQERRVSGRQESTEVSYNEPRMVISAVDECLRNQFQADYKHAVEFSSAAVAARHRYSPIVDVPLVPVYDCQNIDLDQDGPLRQVHHTQPRPNQNQNYMSVDGYIPITSQKNMMYEDESWGRMGNRRMSQVQPSQHQYFQQQPTLGGGLGLGGFQLADYRRQVVA
ncbi:hypothetical protein E3Q06_04222 [Wallemia mellicola]|nr:hypothetical protein E3Q21_04234 [Wallemia mellicola]TIB83293.1 hypothetical protein E3Q20_04216 [Wallemia mellicola]TIC37480.1 hypothetical protein E3Q07_04244 [Wallemia mellicola]TIC44397.1 hypothetical protein E3Q06_04222 [Wallemia mellicola]